MSPSSRLIDLGAGSGKVQQMNLKAEAAIVCGIDPDPRVLQNSHVHVNSSNARGVFRVLIITVLRKPAPEEPRP